MHTVGYFDRQENSAAELTAFLAEKTSKIKTLTSESVDLIGEILGGFGGFIFVIFYFCGWQLVAMWLGAILLIMLTMPLQVRPPALLAISSQSPACTPMRRF